MSSISQQRQAANARNARSSTGPRSAEGKARSSKNALKHGLTSRDAVLPTENATDFHETLHQWLDYYQPQDPAQAAMIERAVVSKWKLDRCTRVETQRLSENIRHADLRYDLDRVYAAEEMGLRLIDDPLNRCDITGIDAPNFGLRMKDRINSRPTLLHRQLQMTSQGVDWLLRRWEELARLLDVHGFWHYHEKHRALWLLGKDFNDVVGDPLAQQLFAACHIARPDREVNPSGRNVWDDCYEPKAHLLTEIQYAHQMDVIRAQSPANADAALSVLREILDTEMRRLRALKAAYLDPLDRLDRAAAREGAMFDASPDSVLLRRYESACEKEFHRSVSDLTRLRKEPPPESDSARGQNEPISESSVEEEVASDEPPPTSVEPIATAPIVPFDGLQLRFERSSALEIPRSTVV